MSIYNITYDPRTDPKALFRQGFENVISGLLQGQQRRRLGEAISKIDPNATPIEVAMMLLSQRLSPQIALGLGGLQQRMQPGVGNIPWAATQMTPAQRQNWLDNYGRGVTIETGQRLLEPGQRQEIAETEFKEKVGLSPSEKNLARKSAEEILKGTRGRWWSYDLPGKTIPDYSQEMMLENYKTWRAENSYDEQTPRKRKELDDLWDSKMALWSKAGIKFDKDNIIGKKEIQWEPNDPEVRKLREVPTETDERRTKEEIQPERIAEEPVIEGAVNESAEINISELAPIFEKARKNGISRLGLYREAVKLKSLNLTKEEMLTAYDKLAEGATAEQLIEFLKSK